MVLNILHVDAKCRVGVKLFFTFGKRGGGGRSDGEALGISPKVFLISSKVPLFTQPRKKECCPLKSGQTCRYSIPCLIVTTLVFPQKIWQIFFFRDISRERSEEEEGGFDQ